MWLRLLTLPAETPLSLAEAKAHLRVDHADEDGLITALIEAATRHLDGRDGILNRALVTQDWEYRIAAFPACGAIKLPFPPLQSVTAVSYVDAAGAVQTLPSSDYVVDTATYEGQIRRAFGIAWPATRCEEHAVRVTFKAGYGTASAVPAPIKQAMKFMIGHFYENREAVGEAAFAELPMAVRYLLGPYRVLSV
jgi:uncharacterized phiE125 gp8 family phage protein